MMKKTRLYNMIFPLWLLLIFPVTWLVVIPANFLIDLLVVVLTMKVLHVSDIWKNAKKVILRVWLMGFVADFIGGMAMFLISNLGLGDSSYFGEWCRRYLMNNVLYCTYENIYAIIAVILCVVLTSFIIYFLNYKFCLKKANLTNSERKKLALSLAVFTAPYLFLFPSEWIM